MAAGDRRGCFTLRAIPRWTGSTAPCWIGCTVGVAELFQLHRLPYPEDLVVARTANGGVISYDIGPRTFFGGTAYRFGLREFMPSGSRRGWTFRLSSQHTKRTLQMLRYHVDDLGIDWYGIVGRGDRALSTCLTSRAVLAGR